jgi:hypothetical protein
MKVKLGQSLMKKRCSVFRRLYADHGYNRPVSRHLLNPDSAETIIEPTAGPTTVIQLKPWSVPPWSCFLALVSVLKISRAAKLMR